MKKIIIWSSVIIGIIIIVGTLSAYFFNFSGSFSNDQAKWGTFGDYVGGVLNPIIGIANLGLLIYLTYEISQIDDKRSQDMAKSDDERSKEMAKRDDERSAREIKNQKDILLSTLKYDCLKELITILAKVDSAFINNENIRVIHIAQEVTTYLESYSFLFIFFSNQEDRGVVTAVESLDRNLWQQQELRRNLDLFDAVTRIEVQEQLIILQSQVFQLRNTFNNEREILIRAVREDIFNSIR